MRTKKSRKRNCTERNRQATSWQTTLPSLRKQQRASGSRTGPTPVALLSASMLQPPPPPTRRDLTLHSLQLLIYSELFLDEIHQTINESSGIKSVLNDKCPQAPNHNVQLFETEIDELLVGIMPTNNNRFHRHRIKEVFRARLESTSGIMDHSGRDPALPNSKKTRNQSAINVSRRIY
ncbi:hypothetical protein GWI33_006481 [Rhynchophorus ferrugineus]|uniref:Uncharacterized protein n=1 Tax=Rhynchophorus ferrugineus TaxID=354439 RepID=A0A834IK97_RHYFE|nr:hypothetical protein GWI33_006481 [Rhynchophorus ferrugineus]